MTERLYYQDSYQLEFDAAVTAVEKGDEGFRVWLDRSAFYPTSGGQLYDTGRMGRYVVHEVAEDNGEIIHILNEEPDFAIGEKVSCIIDEKRRRDNMQKHTGQHILSAALVDVCGAATISARLGEEDSTIDIKGDEINDNDIQRVEDLANLVIFKNRPVSISFLLFDELQDLPLRKMPERRDGEFRIITIEDFDWSTCGGTHCSASGGVGIIKISRTEKIRGLLRIHFLTGLLALEDYRWRLDQIEAISNTFTRHGKESLSAVEALIEDRNRLRRKVTELKKEMLPSLMEKWYNEAATWEGRKIVTLDMSGDDFKDVKQTALALISAHELIVLIGCDDKLLVAVSPDIKLSASEIIKKSAKLFNGRGGGSTQIAQGGGFKPEDIKILLADPSAVLK
ncbi:MAG: hypothetical protein GY841_02255 [FCB group bacterium]|nr:hypothetical protein [FCB group bacterium]